MKLHIILLSSAVLISSIALAMQRGRVLQPTAEQGATPTIPGRPLRIMRPTFHQPSARPNPQAELLKAQRDAAVAEQALHKARQEAQYWKDVATHCQKYGCTKVCIAHVQNNCQQAYKEQQQKALQEFYKQQALKPRAQK